MTVDDELTLMKIDAALEQVLRDTGGLYAMISLFRNAHDEVPFKVVLIAEGDDPDELRAFIGHIEIYSDQDTKGLYAMIIRSRGELGHEEPYKVLLIASTENRGEMRGFLDHLEAFDADEEEEAG